MMEPKQVTFSSECFCAEQIFECGQCFRWNKDEQGRYIGIVGDSVIRVCETAGKIILENTDETEFCRIWRPYFDLNTDYREIQKRLSDGLVMDEAIACGKGIRILSQEPWETLFSFVLSSNNNIPRIKGMIEKLCMKFGKPIAAFGTVFYSFPKAKELEGLEVSDLAFLSAGYRDKYLVDAVKKVNTGEINLEELKQTDYLTAKAKLMKINGVGPKIADCVTLFGLGKREAFPVDVWVRRVLKTLYQKDCTLAQAAEFAQKTFGENAGIAQQYLFYYMRKRGR